MILLQWLINFFVDLFKTISSLIDFIVTAVMGLLSIVTQLPDLLATVSGIAGGLPSILAGFVGATLTVSVIYLMIGRGQGGS